MGAFGSAAAAVFGVFWTIMAVNMGAPIFFALFGVIFVVLGIVQAVYNYKNATGKERFSTFDITDDSEEPDPLNEYFGGNQAERSDSNSHSHASGDTDAFCPYCGAETEKEYLYCTKCGKKLP